MPNAETQEIADVQIRTKIPKKTKTQKDFWIFESSKGSLMCFDPSTAAKLNPSETALYTLNCEDYAPNGEHKNYTVVKNGLIKVTEGAARPAPAPSGPAQGPWTAPQRSGGPGSGMNGDLARDTRISKLSIFAAIVQIQVAKMAVDPVYAACSTAVLACDAIDLTNAVVAELIYPENAAKPATTPAPAATNGPVSDEPPFKQPAQPAAQPASQPASQQMPPVTPPAPAQPAYVPPPVQVATTPQPPAQPPVMMQAPADKQAQAKALFGVKTDMESAMAARVAKMLGKPAPQPQA